MTIHVNIKNLDSRPNAIIEVISFDTYSGILLGNVLPTAITTRSEAILRGGESKDIMLCSSKKLEIIERRNDN